eukprot:scaffold679256_cov104-Prasinocladus_malaysianus.AAC.1
MLWTFPYGLSMSVTLRPFFSWQSASACGVVTTITAGVKRSSAHSRISIMPAPDCFQRHTNRQ